MNTSASIVLLSCFIITLILCVNSKHVKEYQKICQSKGLQNSIGIPQKYKWLFPYEWHLIKKRMVVKETVRLRLIGLFSIVLQFIISIFCLCIQSFPVACVISGVSIFMAGWASIYYGIKLMAKCKIKECRAIDLDLSTLLKYKLLARPTRKCRILSENSIISNTCFFYEIECGRIIKIRHVAKSKVRIPVGAQCVAIHSYSDDAPFWEIEKAGDATLS